MNQIVLLQNISKYLARFSEEVTILNGNNEFHINTHAENLLISLLNAIYDLSLVNMNYSKRGNYAAIDLLDKENKVSFQVTSDPDAKKIKSTIESYFAHKRYETASTLNIYILTDKLKTRQTVINTKINDEKKKLVSSKEISSLDNLPFEFDVQENIFDKRRLYKDLNAINDIDKIKKVEAILKKSFDIIEEESELSTYHNSLKSLYYDVVMDDENGMTLDQIYIEPSFSLHYNTVNFKKTDKSISEKKFYSADHRYKIHEFIEDYLKGENHLNCSSSSRLFLVLGYPGQGKSSFLKRFINDYLKSTRNKEKPLYYFQLRNIRNVREFIEKPLHILHEEACFQLEIDIDKFRFHKSFLLLDGLDELYMRENLKLEDIDKVCKELILLTEKHKQLNIIVTSRYGYIDDERLFRENLLIIQLAEFSLQDQMLWLDKFKVFHSDTWLTDTKLELFNKNYEYNYIKELIRQPILLHMVASLNQEIDENTNKSKIYSQLFTELIDRKYSKDGQIEILKAVTKNDLRNFLREIAFSIYQSGEEYITKNALLKLESTQEFLKLFPGNNFADSIKGIMISFYFKEVKKRKDQDYEDDRSDYAIEFLHKSLKEYLVAEKIVNTLTTEFLDIKKSNGKYVIDDWKQGLKLLNSLFSKVELTHEIHSYIKENIINEKTLPKVELCDRILLHLMQYLSKGFIYDFHSETENNPIKKSINCFTATWSFISSLGLTKNYFTNTELKRKFVDFLFHVGVEEEFYDLDFSHQDLSNMYLSNLSFSNCKFTDANFSNVIFSDVIFDNCLIEKSNLEGSEFFDCSLSSCKVNQSIFERSKIEEIRLYKPIFSNCNFNESNIFKIKFLNHTRGEDKTIQYINFNECTFENVMIESKILRELANHSINTNFNNTIEPNFKKTNKPTRETQQKKHKKTLPKNYKRLIF
jgi:uncharacterized protein YjbI with pentapeptide repeats/ribosomal protein L23